MTEETLINLMIGFNIGAIVNNRYNDIYFKD